ncbi:MAG: enoyl-CoA hydratase/isomerase family protein, partial [Gemmatimonadota bacterium]
MTTETIRTATAEGIGTLTLDRPPLNILSRAMLAELRDGLDAMAARDDARVLVLRAEGEHFSAGADVGEHLPPEFEEMIPEFLDTVRAIDAFPLPVIAAV